LVQVGLAKASWLNLAPKGAGNPPFHTSSASRVECCKTSQLRTPSDRVAMAMVAGQHDFQSLVLTCNKDGMDALRKGQSKAAFEQFKYAEAILIAHQAEGSTTSLLAVTCNNLGCYYKKVGKFHGALSYLRQALKMEIELGTDEVTLAGTHLNICAILSKLEKHEQAVQHAHSALELINQRIKGAEPDTVSQDDYSVLAIAYHNVAVERDHLQHYEKAAAAFQQGHQVAKRCLGEDHPLAITLGQNCDAVLQKSQKSTRSPMAAGATRRNNMKSSDLSGKGPSVQSTASILPVLPGAQPQPKDETLPMPQRSVRQDAAEWIASEESAWSNFARSTLSGGPRSKEESQSMAQRPPFSPQSTQQTTMAIPPHASESLRDAQTRDLGVPAVGDATITAPLATTRGPKKTPLVQAMDDHPEALMDIIEADRTGHAVGATKTAPHDFRPNRLIKGSTRTSRVVRRTGLHNSTRHRDEVMSNRHLQGASFRKSAHVQNMAAERIQRAWRAWYKYCQENADWMTTTWICATMIQANWRSYHVRRKKLDKAANCIQRHVRGHLVRKVLRKHQAAVSIQRHVIGMLTRNQLRKLHKNAVKMQALIRGGAGRKRARNKREFLTKTATTIQCGVRCFIAKKRARELRDARNKDRQRQKAANDIQRLFRGYQGRNKAADTREKYLQDLKDYQAAQRLQAMVRRDQAIKRVDAIRAVKLEEMNKAANFLRKMWLGARTRKRYRDLINSFAAHEKHVITIQRFARGFLVRLKMWREAIRAEAELWAVLEIQRVWRGYKGRVEWEGKYENVWQREMAAAMIQRNIRGWLARTRVSRMRRRIARSEFERARMRFRSAQRLQAMSRGVLTRKVTRARHAKAVQAAVSIQRMYRGHALRKRLWTQVTELRAIMIQAAIRGFIVRKRRFHLVAKVICVQRAWRRHRARPRAEKVAAQARALERKKMAAVIQRRFREHQEHKEIGRIQQT